MGLLNPTALLLLGLIPLLALAYLVRERPTRVTVSSVLAFRALRGMKAEKPLGPPHFDLLFLIEMLLIALAALTIAGPYLVRQRRPLAVVLDNSAAMQARMPSGQTRYEAARSRLAAQLSGEDRTSAVTIFATAPQPHQVGEAAQSLSQARSTIERIAVNDAPSDPAGVSRLLSDFNASERFERIIFASSAPLSGGSPERLAAITVGGPIPNYAIGSFTLRRESFGSESFKARITLANFATAPQTLGVTILGDGKKLARAEARLEPRELGAVEFPQLQAAASYKAELTPDDDFALDNAAWATPATVAAVNVLFVTPTADDAANLRNLPGVKVRVLSPAQFAPADAASADVVIFEYAVPREMPASNALLVMPPAGDPLFGFDTRALNKLDISAWRSPDPLTDGVNFRLLDIQRGEALGTHPWMQAAVSGAQGALILAGERQGHRYIAMGFNPFPYLGRKNLPMSVLTLNLLSQLAGLGSDSSGLRTGDPWQVPAGVEKIVAPAGEQFQVKSGTFFTGAAQQGIYQLVGADGGKRLRAVNLADLAVSDLEAPLAVKVDSATAAPASAGRFSHREQISYYLVAAMLALAMLELLFAYRRRTVTVESL